MIERRSFQTVFASPTAAFYRTRVRQFCRKFNDRDLASLTPLEIDEHLAEIGSGMSASTRHHNALVTLFTAAPYYSI